MGVLMKLLNEWICTTFLVGLLIIYTVYCYFSRPKNIPPGPRGLPLLGYMPFLGKVPYDTYLRLGQKYGSLYSFYIGNQLVVVLNDFHAINEAFVKQADTFSGRPEGSRKVYPADFDKNVVTMDGHYWSDHRRFIMTSMRDFGIGKASIELRIMDEIDRFLHEMQKLEGKCFDIRNIFTLSVANNISAVLLGKRYDYNDPLFLEILHKMDVSLRLGGTMTLLGFFPWLRHIPGLRKLVNYDVLRKLIQEIESFLRDIVHEHKSVYTDGQRDDFINAFLTEQKARNQKSKDADETFSDDALVCNLRATQRAGIETTSTTLLWSIIFMMHHPEVQRKVQKEIDQVIGVDRVPSWNDRFRTPYTEATICEIQRMANVIPINLPHRNIVECELLGYNIPRNTCIISLLGKVLMDSKLWGDPQNFRPERFLNGNGEVERPPYFVPFSLGKRQCLGETLAKMELYLYFTSVLQKFSFIQPSPELPNDDYHIGVTRIPENPVARVISRH